MLDAASIITALLVLLCTLASLDLWRQYAIRNENYWFVQYTFAARSSQKFWNFGFRVEDLEIKLDHQQSKFERIKSLMESMQTHPNALRTSMENSFDFEKHRQSRISVNHLGINATAAYFIHCESEGPMLRVGVNDFRTDPRDVCQVFTGSTKDISSPHNMFEVVPFGTEGSISLRSISNGYYVRTVPPPVDNSMAPWKLVIGSPVVGSLERFRLTDEGYLYSSVMGGFFQCGAGDMVKGYAGKYSNYKRFVLKQVGDEDLRKARRLVHLSNQIEEIQTEYVAKHKSSEQVQKAAVDLIIGMDNPHPVKICLAVPMTSKGTMMTEVKDSPFWSNLFDSFMKSIDWRSNRYIFKFYLGFDKADAIYDTGDSWSDMREEFKARATFRMTEQLMEEDEIEQVLKKRLMIKLMHFEHLEGAPTQIVSQLVLAAYVDNYDYFYQVNDDTSIVSPNWPPKLIGALASNPSIPNFGVTGPSDTNNEKIFTHSFVHRTHVEVFGHLFPPSFKNWWSDDWITTVYGSAHTFRVPDVEIKHNVGAQKLHGYTRYEVDQSASLRLEEELRKGHVQIDEWLKKNSLPRLPLPNVCGYIPLVKYLARALESKATESVEISA